MVALTSPVYTSSSWPRLLAEAATVREACFGLLREVPDLRTDVANIYEHRGGRAGMHADTFVRIVLEQTGRPVSSGRIT
jgi:hypothetical protein